ncbi:hypothetical protein HOY82DRAFT_606372 [Tuber indicum]|nr:hypothetical protein HOY82DRAFT_606372 [Tuber indicum]
MPGTPGTVWNTDCRFVTGGRGDLYQHQMDAHPGEELKIPPLRNLDSVGYRERDDLRKAKTSDEIYKILSGQEGSEPVPWEDAESNFAGPAQGCTKDIRRQYGTGPRSHTETGDVLRDLKRHFSAIALTAIDNL